METKGRQMLLARSQIITRFSFGICKISDKYKGREWMPMTAIILSPLKGYHEIDVNDDGPLVKDILPESEFDFIKNNSIDNQTYNYMLVLLNFDHKVIQFMPINFTFKTII